MLSQNEIVDYRGNKATILGFMKDNTICIEVTIENQKNILYVNRNEIKQLEIK